jgi:hypothetical protein
MGNPFLFADRFSGAVVHLTTGDSEERRLGVLAIYCKNKQTTKTKNARDSLN